MSRNGCLFCRIGAKQADAVILWDDTELMAFLDIAPIRDGHCHVIPKMHYETFEVVPPALAGRIIAAGQDLAKRLKSVYGVERVSFLFTGGDVPHAHAHIIPMHEKTDITSARYLLNPTVPKWGSDHLRVTRKHLLAVRTKLGFSQ